MTEKDKELLLQDLCGRLPYGVICKTSKGNGHLCSINQTIFGIEYGINIKATERDYFNDRKEIIKPYLRPLSSMTEEERELLNRMAFRSSLKCFEEEDPQRVFSLRVKRDVEELAYLYEHHYDVNGLIPAGLALSTDEFDPYKD